MIVDPPVKVRRRAEDPRRQVHRLHDPVAGRAAPLVLPHVVAIDQVKLAFLAGRDHQVRMSAGLVRQHDDAAGGQVRVVGRQRRLVERGEVIRHAQARARQELQHGFAVGGAHRAGDGEVTVARRHVDRAGRVAGGAAVPDAAEAAVRRDVEGRHQLQRLGVVGRHPTVVEAGVTMRRPSDVDDAVEQEEPVAIQRPRRIERRSTHHRAAHVGGHAAVEERRAEDRVADNDGAAELLGSRREVERVQSLHEVGL